MRPKLWWIAIALFGGLAFAAAASWADFPGIPRWGVGSAGANIDDTAGSGIKTATWSADKLLSYFMPRAGGTFEGWVALPSGSPTQEQHAATKKYVDDKVGTLGTMASQDANSVEITGGSISGVTLSFGALSANGYRGLTYTMVAGESISAYDVVAVRNSSGTAKVYKYSADASDGDKLLTPVGIATNAASSGENVVVLLDGIARNSSWGITSNQDEGKPVFASETDGAIALTAPSGSGDVVVVIGRVLNAASKIILVRPSLYYVVVQ